MRFIEDMSPDERMKYFENRRKQQEEQQEQQALNDAIEKMRYRCEQTTVVKSNGVILTHGNTKREFIVYRKVKEGSLRFKIEMADNIVTMVPNQLTEAAKFLNEFENVKSTVIASVDNNSGLINHILNHKDIINRWHDYKNELFSKYSFLRSENNKNNRDNYIALAERVITDEKTLINDLETKMFYDLFFGRYLVSTKNLFEPYKREFNSQLFDGVKIVLDFKQDVINESSEMYVVKKTGKLNKNYDLDTVRHIYDKKYKPQIQYKFSEFDFMMIENTVIDTKGSPWIEQSDVSMAERVKNNIELFVDYKLKRIEN